jgi:mannan endo-1,4-beta-mannosidase
VAPVRLVPAAAVLLLAGCGLTACSAVSNYKIATGPTGPAAAAGPAACSSSARAARLAVGTTAGAGRSVGVAATGFPPDAASLTAFSRATGADLAVVSYYAPFGSAFDASAACQVIRMHALPLIQLDPRNVSVAAIADGRYRGYLTRYAAAVRAFGGPVAISFGHEMNGNWYPWGYADTPPATFVRAWRAIHRAFTAARARNVTWVWTVNGIGPNAAVPLRDDWPGAGYVNWVGLDAYYRTPTSTFAGVFRRTLTDIRTVTGDPVLIAETAAAPSPSQAAQIRSLFTGVRRSPGVIGFVWFDINAKEPWRIDNDPAALRAFRQGIESWKRRG